MKYPYGRQQTARDVYKDAQPVTPKRAHFLKRNLLAIIAVTLFVVAMVLSLIMVLPDLIDKAGL